MCLGGAPLDEPRRPQPDQPLDERRAPTEVLGQHHRPFQDLLQLDVGVAAAGVQGRGHLLEDRQLVHVAGAARRSGSHDRQRRVVHEQRLGVGEDAARDLGRPAVVGDGPLGPSTAGVLLRELGRDRTGVVGVQPFQSLGDAPVQQPAPRRGDPCVGGVAHQVVGEVVGLPALAQDPQPPQLVDGRDHVVGVQLAGRHQQVQRDVPADRRGQLRALLGRRARLREPRAQYGVEVAGG